MANAETASGRQSGSRSDPPAMPQLSCELCRERKMKCDKLEPCSTCVAAGVECVSIFRPRLPRGRHAHRKGANTAAGTAGTAGTAASDQAQQKSKPRQQAQQPSNSRKRPKSTASTTVAGGSDSVGTSSNKPSSGDEMEGNESSSIGTGLSGNIGGSNMRAVAPLDFQQPLSPLPSTDPTISMQSLAGANSNMPHMSATFSANPFDVSMDASRPSGPQADEFKFDDFSSNPYMMSDDLGNSNAMQASDMLLSDNATGPFRMLCAGGSGMEDTPVTLPSTCNISFARLCQVYLNHVDPVVKILHRPSISKLMELGEPYLSYPKGHPTVAALIAAVCYVAACSLSERQCQTMFQVSKKMVTTQTQQSCENALEQAEVLTTSDMTVLQAFVLYLIGRRSKEQGKVVWSLVSLAVRLAKGMSLHSDSYLPPNNPNGSFFEGQMRKRLWLTICVMDLQASFAYGSEPLISVEEVSTVLDGLKHVNDTDFDPGTADEVMDREDLTNVTFAFVTYLAQISGRLLHYSSSRQEISVQADSTRGSISSTSSALEESSQLRFSMNQNERERISAAFDEKAFTLLRFCDPEESHQAWFTWHSTQTLVASTRLAALRPPQQLKPGADQIWPADMRRDQYGDAELQLALRILEKVQLMHTDPRSEGLRWYVTIPWHALAVVVTGCHLCSDESILRRAWPVVEFVWQLQADHSGQRDQKALAVSLDKQIRQTRDRLRPLLHSPVKSSLVDSWTTNFSNINLLTPALSTAFHTPTTSSSAASSYFPVSAATTAADSIRTRSLSSATAPPGAKSQGFQKKSWDPFQPDSFSAHAGFDLGRPLQGQQGIDPSMQLWDDSIFADVDSTMSSDVNMAHDYINGSMMQ